LLRVLRDERGEFRVVLGPGKIYLRTSSADFSIRHGDATEPFYLPVYYPGSEQRASASIIKLAPGQQATEIAFHLTPAPRLRISGKVSGIPAQTSTVIFLDADGMARPVPTNPDETFAILGLPSGSATSPRSAPPAPI
jgi:hypothetical protein